MNWRPIETAPRDGTKFLATGYDNGQKSAGRHAAVVRWLGDHPYDDGLFVDSDGEHYDYLDLWTEDLPV